MGKMWLILQIDLNKVIDEKRTTTFKTEDQH